MEIVFTKIFDVPDLYQPKPAFKKLPDWYKETTSYINGEKKPPGNGTTTATIKKCMPVLDVITCGYIITTYTDVWVTKKQYEIQKEDGTRETIDKHFSWYEWRSFEPINFHPLDQAPDHPLGNGMEYPKWINPWAIKTPPGYSCLFTQPFHSESIFTIMDGLVDTDSYRSPVNFPFVLNDKNFEGLIPAGTPIAQVVPIKRDEWKMRIGNEKDLKNHKKDETLLITKMFDSYKTHFRKSKTYK